MLLKPIEILELNKKFNLSAATAAYIEARRFGNPSRMVDNSRTTSVTGTVTSEKTDLSIDYESAGPEKCFAILCEFDDSIREFYTQLEPISLKITNKNGKKQTIWYTADFLVLGDFRPKVFEIKSFEDAEKLIEEKPTDWKKDVNGNYRYLPAERAFNDMGIDFFVWVLHPKDTFRISNYRYILRARESYDEEIDALVSKAHKILSEKFCISMAELMEEIGVTDTTPLIQMIDRGDIRADLVNALISIPSGLLIARNQVLLEEGIKLWQEKQIYSGERIEEKSLSHIPKQNAAERALKNLEHFLKGINDRQFRHLRKRIRERKTESNSLFQCLIPDWHKSGNYLAKAPKVVKDFLVEYILRDHTKLPGASKSKSFANYKQLAKAAHPRHKPLSSKTFRNTLQQKKTLVALKQGGKRAKNAAKSPTNPLERNIKAMIPWEAAAIDHYLASIYLIFFRDGDRIWVEKPWITWMVDIATNEILAYSISFLRPSRKSFAKCIRDCVRRHGQLPNEIASDHGSDFISVYCSSLLAHYGIDKSLRPVAYPEFGSEVEGSFGEFEQDYLCMLPGNSVNQPKSRSVDGNKTPRNSAILTIEQFSKEVENFIQWRSAKIRGDALHSISYNYNSGVRQFPFMGKKIEYDPEFMVMTAVDVKNYSIHPSKGIHINERWYYAKELDQLLGKKSKTLVRTEPENPYVVYALVDTKWVPCWNGGIQTFKSYSPETQRAQGLIKIEGRNLRDKAREIQDEELMAKLHQLPTDIQQPSKTLPVEITEEYEWESSYDFTSVRPITSESWVNTL